MQVTFHASVGIYGLRVVGQGGIGSISDSWVPTSLKYEAKYYAVFT